MDIDRAITALAMVQLALREKIGHPKRKLNIKRLAKQYGLAYLVTNNEIHQILTIPLKDVFNLADNEIK